MSVIDVCERVKTEFEYCNINGDSEGVFWESEYPNILTTFEGNVDNEKYHFHVNINDVPKLIEALQSCLEYVNQRKGE